MASPDDDPPPDDPVPAPGVGVEDMVEFINGNLLEEHICFDEDDNPVGDELDEAFWIAGRGHLESIDFYDASADDGSSDDGASAGGGSDDGASAGASDGVDPPLFEFGTNDVWGPAETTDDPTQDAADVSADPPKADPDAGNTGGQSGDPGAGS